MNPMELNNINQAREYEQIIRKSASKVQHHIQELASSSDSLYFLEKLKFERIGYDPLDSTNQWNLIEQLNQTFTYLASFRAAALLFKWYPQMESLSLNLGTVGGTDIESSYSGGIAAEVFAATNPNSNRKLNNDIAKVQEVSASHKYVFFMCPNIDIGNYDSNNAQGVKIWSLGI